MSLTRPVRPPDRGQGTTIEGHRARRRFSQNFLHDPAVIDRIVGVIDPRRGERIVEIGPGLGALTAQLVERAGRLIAVEIDRDLAARLRERYTNEQLTLIESDALKLDWQALAGDGHLRIVGNLPYNVSTPLLFALLPIAGSVRDQHFMLQREVVERMAAPPGGKEYGRLSVMLQFRYRIQRLFNVAPGSFSPVPKVQSSIVRMTPLAPGEVPDAPLEAFAQVVSAAFSQRRKTLRNALGNLLTEGEIESAQIDPRERAERLAVGDFARLARILDARIAAGAR